MPRPTPDGNRAISTRRSNRPVRRGDREDPEPRDGRARPRAVHPPRPDARAGQRVGPGRTGRQQHLDQRLQPGTSTLQTLINVGDLAPDEERWPTDETYHFDDYPQARQVLSDLKVWVTDVDDPMGDAMEIALLKRLGKRTALAAP